VKVENLRAGFQHGFVKDSDGEEDDECEGKKGIVAMLLICLKSCDLFLVLMH